MFQWILKFAAFFNSRLGFEPVQLFLLSPMFRIFIEISIECPLELKKLVVF